MCCWVGFYDQGKQDFAKKVLMASVMGFQTIKLGGGG